MDQSNEVALLQEEEEEEEGYAHTITSTGGEDPLAPLPTFHNNHSPTVHMKTYTAGEDSGRLAAAARELGLEKSREPRRQVREPRYSKTTSSSRRRNYSSLLQQQTRQVLSLLLDSAMEDARMLSVYSSHVARDLNDEDHAVVWSRLPEFTVKEDELLGNDDLDDDEDEEGTGMDDAHGHEITSDGGSLTAAVLGIIKGMVGPAILYLPHGFASAGWLVAIPIMAATTVMFLYSCQCLFDSWRFCHDEEEVEKRQHLNNNETAHLLENRGTNYHHDHRGSGAAASTTNKKKRQMLSYPELAYRGLGVRGESIVKTGICLMQSGVCLTYLIFVPQNLHASMKILFGWDVSPQFWLLVMVALQIPLSWIRDIRKLTPTNLVANLLILYGLVACLGFAFSSAMTTMQGGAGGGPLENIWRHYLQLVPFKKDWYLFIGTSVLLFEGSITLLVPLQEAVPTDELRRQFPAVYYRVILCIICFYAFFGTICWMAFGQDVKTVLTTSLPAGVLATTVQLAYSIAVVFTFPLQNFPSLEITCRTVKFWASLSSSSTTVFWSKRNVISSILVATLAVVAVCTMDSLDKVVSLMGSLLGCPIAFVFPPMIHSSLVTDISTARLCGNRIVAGLGVIAMIAASSITLASWK